MTKAGYPLPPRPSLSSAVTASNSPANAGDSLPAVDDMPKKKRRRQSAPAGSSVPPMSKSVGKRETASPGMEGPIAATTTRASKKRESRGGGGLEEQVIEE